MQRLRTQVCHRPCLLTRHLFLLKEQCARKPHPVTFTTLKRTPGISATVWRRRPNPEMIEGHTATPTRKADMVLRRDTDLLHAKDLRMRRATEWITFLSGTEVSGTGTTRLKYYASRIKILLRKPHPTETTIANHSFPRQPTANL